MQIHSRLKRLQAPAFLLRLRRVKYSKQRLKENPFPIKSLYFCKGKGLFSCFFSSSGKLNNTVHLKGGELLFISGDWSLGASGARPHLLTRKKEKKMKMEKKYISKI
jgi:hypothetical protein